MNSKSKKQKISPDIITNGPIFSDVINQLKEGKDLAVANAVSLMEKIVDTYSADLSSADIGASGTGIATNDNTDELGPTGLLYGRIQSGKTRAMITTAALAFDNKFRIVVVLTSNINRLADQTHGDFVGGIPNATIIYKDDMKSGTLESEAATVAESLEYIPDYGVVIVCSKGPQVLTQVIEFLKQIGASKYPAIILDDEGDQATPDTQNRKRAKEGAHVKPSTTNALIHKSADGADSLRTVLSSSVFVSVTGTPQSLLLQSTESTAHPSFVQLLGADPKAYTGAAVYFDRPDPLDNQYITLIDEDEAFNINSEDAVIPEGLKEAVTYFILAATAASMANGGKWMPYKMLIHTSVNKVHHGRVRELLYPFIHDVTSAIRDPKAASSQEYMKLLSSSYDSLAKKVKGIAPLADLLEVASKQLARRKINEVNSKTTGMELRYVDGYNFVVGGNSVGRGLAFTDLLVTYYVREAKTTNMDTMFQHARMFGYRRPYIAFTQVFLPPQLYDRFYAIADSDEQLRDYISDRGEETALKAIIQVQKNLRATRPNVLDGNIRMLAPGRQLYPNKPIYSTKHATAISTRVKALLADLLPNYHVKSVGEKGVTITAHQAVALLEALPTRANNGWNDKQMPEILLAIANKTGDGNIQLKYRTANRSDEQGAMRLSTGALGNKVREAADTHLPTLFIYEITPKESTWDTTPFMYPTIVLPTSIKSMIYNNGKIVE